MVTDFRIALSIPCASNIFNFKRYIFSLFNLQWLFHFITFFLARTQNVVVWVALHVFHFGWKHSSTFFFVSTFHLQIVCVLLCLSDGVRIPSHSVSSQADILKFSLSKCSEAQLTWTEKKQEFTWTQLQRPETQVQVWKKTNRKYTSQPRNHKSLLESSTQFMFKG